MDCRYLRQSEPVWPALGRPSGFGDGKLLRNLGKARRNGPRSGLHLRQQLVEFGPSITTKVIELKAKAAEKFRQEIEGLAEPLRNKNDDVPLEFSRGFREIASAILVEPRKSEEEYVIKGRPSAVAGPELSAFSADTVVAGGRVELPTLGL